MDMEHRIAFSHSMQIDRPAPKKSCAISGSFIPQKAWAYETTLESWDVPNLLKKFNLGNTPVEKDMALEAEMGLDRGRAADIRRACEEEVRNVFKAIMTEEHGFRLQVDVSLDDPTRCNKTLTGFSHDKNVQVSGYYGFPPSLSVTAVSQERFDQFVTILDKAGYSLQAPPQLSNMEKSSGLAPRSIMQSGRKG